MALAMSAAAYGQTAPPVDPALSADEAYSLARERYDERRFEESLALLQHAQRRTPHAAHVFEIARTLEELGRLADARDAFLRVLDQPGADDAVMRLAQAAAERLGPSVTQAIVRLDRAPPGALLQLDDGVVGDPTQERVLRPGRHTLCVRTASADRLSCWSRVLAAGVRVTWPPAARPATRGTIDLTATTLAELHVRAIDGQALFLDTRGVTTLELDAGAHKLELTGPHTPAWRTSADVAAGGAVSLTRESVTPPDEPPSAGVGPGPWIVLGTGGAALVAGVVLLIVDSGARGSLEDSHGEVNSSGFVSGITQVDARADYDQADVMRASGATLTAVGGTAVVSALIWWLAGGSDATP